MRVLMAILMCALLSGCGMLSPVKVRTLSTYNLSMPNETSKIEKSYSLTADKNKKSSKVLLLATMSADPGYSSDRMIYVTREHELQAYAHHAWVAPPAQMILPMMADALRQQNYFHAVEMAPYPGTSQEILELRLKDSENLTARSTRTGSSPKRDSGSPISLKILLFRSRIPPTKSYIFRVAKSK